MTALDQDVRHGVPAGAQWHKRNNVPLCEPCRKANNQYQARYRAGVVGDNGLAYAEKNRRGNAARHAALQELKSRHISEYQQLLADEKRKRGIS